MDHLHVAKVRQMGQAYRILFGKLKKCPPGDERLAFRSFQGR